MSSEEPKRIFLGVVTVESGEAIPVFDIPLDADPDTIKAAIAAAEAEKVAAAARESERLKKMFLGKSETAADE
jgi:hypothetical protein